jgi:starch-binding outer membrane protein, SusD/RagB family
MKTQDQRGTWYRRLNVLILVALTSGTLAACDFSVVNPGPVADMYLDHPGAWEGIVNGANRALSFAIASGTGNGLGYDAAMITREIHPSGATGSYGHSVFTQRGFLTAEDASTPVDRGQEARWLAENAVSRLREAMGPDSFKVTVVGARALLLTGYSNRLLGEHVCETVIDGGPAQSFKIHFTRAEAAFTEALAVAQAAKNTTLANAALAGRASVRTWLGNWTGAAADAALVPAGFKYETQFNALERDQHNSFYYATSGPSGPFITFTVWHTWYADNFDQFKDPRTPYAKYASTPLAPGGVGDLGDGRGVIGRVPYYQQKKHPDYSSPIRLSSYQEAQLIVAESKLRAGDWQGALTIINAIRTGVGVTPRTAANATETWTWLKLEKLTEFWLEGRTMGERRRWLGDGADPVAPGPLPDLLRMDDRAGKDRCYPISLSETQTNPNFNK